MDIQHNQTAKDLVKEVDGQLSLPNSSAAAYRCQDLPVWYDVRAFGANMGERQNVFEDFQGDNPAHHDGFIKGSHRELAGYSKRNSERDEISVKSSGKTLDTIDPNHPPPLKSPESLNSKPIEFKSAFAGRPTRTLSNVPSGIDKRAPSRSPPTLTAPLPHDSQNLSASAFQSLPRYLEPVDVARVTTETPRLVEREFLLHEDQLLVTFFTDLHPRALIPCYPQLREWLTIQSGPLQLRWEQMINVYENLFQRAARLQSIEDHRLVNLGHSPAEILEQARAMLKLKGGLRAYSKREKQQPRGGNEQDISHQRTMIRGQCKDLNKCDDDLKVPASLLQEAPSAFEQSKDILDDGFVGDYAESTLGDDLLRSIPQFERFAKHTVLKKSCLRVRITARDI